MTIKEHEVIRALENIGRYCDSTICYECCFYYKDICVLEGNRPMNFRRIAEDIMEGYL